MEIPGSPLDLVSSIFLGGGRFHRAVEKVRFPALDLGIQASPQAAKGATPNLHPCHPKRWMASGAPEEMKIGGVRGRRCGTVKAVGALEVEGPLHAPRRQDCSREFSQRRQTQAQDAIRLLRVHGDKGGVCGEGSLSRSNSAEGVGVLRLRTTMRVAHRRAPLRMTEERTGVAGRSTNNGQQQS